MITITDIANELKNNEILLVTKINNTAFFVIIDIIDTNNIKTTLDYSIEELLRKINS